MARAGWAAVLVDAQGRMLQVRCSGRASDGGACAELQAVLWVAEGSVGAVLVVTDCEHVSSGAAVLAADPRAGRLRRYFSRGATVVTCGAAWRPTFRGFAGCRGTWTHPGPG